MLNPETMPTTIVMGGYVPLHPKDRGMVKNPESSAAHAAALRAVLLHLIADTFDLREEEVMWAGFHLDKVLAPLLDLTPHSVPFAVRQEMLDGTYTRLLSLRARVPLVRAQVPFDSKVLHASVEDWTETLIAPIAASYKLRPLTEATMRGQILGLLRELGVGHPTTPRGATHLPTDLRSRIFTDRSKR